MPPHDTTNPPAFLEGPISTETLEKLYLDEPVIVYRSHAPAIRGRVMSVLRTQERTHLEVISDDYTDPVGIDLRSIRLIERVGVVPLKGSET